MKSSKGFTLIELLVVIAIIGILSGVVLASLNSARAKGANVAIKADLANIRPQAEILYDTDNDYDAVCGANSIAQNTTIAQQIAHAQTVSGVAPVCGKPASGSASAWAVAATLKDGTFWCVDSTGVAKGTQAAGTTAYTALTGGSTAALTDSADVACN